MARDITDCEFIPPCTAVLGRDSSLRTSQALSLCLLGKGFAGSVLVTKPLGLWLQEPKMGEKEEAQSHGPLGKGLQSSDPCSELSCSKQLCT